MVTGKFVHPHSHEEAVGFVCIEKLSKKEYARLELIAQEYGGYWFPEVKAFLFPNDKALEEFLDDYNDNYQGTELVKPILKSRGRSGLKDVLRSTYGVEIVALEEIPMDFHRLKLIIAEFIDTFGNYGLMRYSNGKVKYATEEDKELVKEFFKGLVEVGIC